MCIRDSILFGIPPISSHGFTPHKYLVKCTHESDQCFAVVCDGTRKDYVSPWGQKLLKTGRGMYDFTKPLRQNSLPNLYPSYVPVGQADDRTEQCRLTQRDGTAPHTYFAPFICSHESTHVFDLYLATAPGKGRLSHFLCMTTMWARAEYFEQ